MTLAIRYHSLRFADRLEFGSAAHAALHLLHAEGRAIQVDLPAGWISLWMPLGGQLQIESHDGSWNLSRRRMLIWNEGPIRSHGRSAGWWLALLGPAGAWSRHLQPSAGAVTATDSIFPQEFISSPELRRLLIRLTRVARRVDARTDAADALIEACCASLLDQQRGLQDLLARCSGRTLQRRRQTLLRLLRVQRLIGMNPASRPDLARLARAASYSPLHLMRIYRDVFGETPIECASRIRMERAWEMVREDRYSICDITASLGFESQSAFCRAFKNTYGVTSTQVRRHLPSPDELPLRHAG